MKVKDVKASDIKDWRANLKSLKTDGDMTDGSKDRILNVLIAALNYAVYELHIVSADRAVEWGRVKRLEKKSARRKGHLTVEERARLVAAAPLAAQPFLRALCLLPLRPGALANCRVEDLHCKVVGGETLWIEKDKVNGRRAIELTKEAADFLKEQAKGKLPKAFLFTTMRGLMWTSDRWKGIIDRAVATAGLDETTCAYTLRHSVITDLLNGGMRVHMIADIAGTSITEINNHYAERVEGMAREKMASIAL